MDILLQLFAKWCETTGIKIPFEKRQYYHICSLHFDPDCFFPINRNRTNLKVGSIPTLLLNESGKFILIHLRILRG